MADSDFKLLKLAKRLCLKTRKGCLYSPGNFSRGEAALLVGRKYIGYELKPEYIKGSQVRLESYIQEELLEAA